MADDVTARPTPAVRHAAGPVPGAVAAPTAVIASIPATLLLILAQRSVAAGITAGAGKD